MARLGGRPRAERYDAYLSLVRSRGPAVGRAIRALSSNTDYWAHASHGRARLLPLRPRHLDRAVGAIEPLLHPLEPHPRDGPNGRVGLQL